MKNRITALACTFYAINGWVFLAFYRFQAIKSFETALSSVGWWLWSSAIRTAILNVPFANENCQSRISYMLHFQNQIERYCSLCSIHCPSFCLNVKRWYDHISMMSLLNDKKWCIIKHWQVFWMLINDMIIFQWRVFRMIKNDVS